MGLKFQREDSLDKMFEEFAILPENKEKNKAIERFLTPEKKDENKDNKKDQNA